MMRSRRPRAPWRGSGAVLGAFVSQDITASVSLLAVEFRVSELLALVVTGPMLLGFSSFVLAPQSRVKPHSAGSLAVLMDSGRSPGGWAAGGSFAQESPDEWPSLPARETRLAILGWGLLGLQALGIGWFWVWPCLHSSFAGFCRQRRQESGEALPG